jgi:hypothetical protein
MGIDASMMPESMMSYIDSNATDSILCETSYNPFMMPQTKQEYKAEPQSKKARGKKAGTKQEPLPDSGPKTAKQEQII